MLHSQHPNILTKQVEFLDSLNRIITVQNIPNTTATTMIITTKRGQKENVEVANLTN